MEYVEGLKKRRDEVRSLIKNFENKLSPLIQELNALEQLLSVVEGQSAYPIDGKIPERILFVLSEINQGTAKQIREYMLRFEPEVKLNSINMNTSRMASEGIIKSEKKGHANIYSLKS